jgi:hypothetical protein
MICWLASTIALRPRNSDYRNLFNAAIFGHSLAYSATRRELSWLPLVILLIVGAKTLAAFINGSSAIFSGLPLSSSPSGVNSGSALGRQRCAKRIQ